MRFNTHYALADSHAFLAPSKPAWLKYDDAKLDRVFFASEAAKRGTALHDLAERLISLGQTLTKNTKTLNMYVNDAIGFHMTPEQTLVYSPNCFGKADAIGFRSEKLRIHDLKTGVTQTSFMQLMVYAALFCLEYHIRPFEIETELRIYQNDEMKSLIPDPIDISSVMEIIKYQDKRVELLKEEVSS